MTISRKDSQTLSGTAARTGATVLGGTLTKEGDHYFINKTDVTALLETLVGEQVVFIAADVCEKRVAQETKTCLTCGRDYTESACPHCANVRARLRGGQ